jgi:hypothetical protein
MTIDLPVVSVTIGPTWAQLLNDALQDAVDPHDHTTGRGTPVPSAGISINADLAWNNRNLNTVREVRLQDQLGNLSAVADRGGIYRNADDLFYLDGAGNNVRITSAGGVVGAPGNIAGLAAPAAATYSAITKTFTWTQDANFPAKMDSGEITFRETVLNGNGVTFKAPVGLAAGYSVTWPGALPAATHMMGMTAGGVVSVADDPTFNSRPTFEGLNPGNTADTTAGNIRVDTGRIQGYEAADWRNLSGWEYLGGATLGAGATTLGNISIAARDFLMIVVRTRQAGAGASFMRFNSDAGANYNYQSTLMTSANAWSNTISNAANEIMLNPSFTDPVVVGITIGNFTTLRKPCLIRAQHAPTTLGDMYNDRPAVWENTAAQITSIEVFNSAAVNFDAGSSIAIFGRNN